MPKPQKPKTLTALSTIPNFGIEADWSIRRRQRYYWKYFRCTGLLSLSFCCVDTWIVSFPVWLKKKNTQRQASCLRMTFPRLKSIRTIGALRSAMVAARVYLAGVIMNCRPMIVKALS